MISKEISYVIPDNFPECKNCKHLKQFQKNNEKTLNTLGFYKSTRFVDLTIKCNQTSDSSGIMVRLSQEGNYFIGENKDLPLQIRYEESQFPLECPVLKANRGLTNTK
jgi:hypothetical protein